MSTFAYAQLTTNREQAQPGTSTTTSPPGLGTYIDVVAALVPAEVLSVHALMLSFTTMTQKNKAGQAFTTITDPGTLKFVFFALIALSMVLYVAGHRTQWDAWDGVRVLIPPVAFVLWTMLQQATAFDAVFPTMRQAPRYAIAVISAILIGVIAGALAVKADQKPVA